MQKRHEVRVEQVGHLFASMTLITPRMHWMNCSMVWTCINRLVHYLDRHHCKKNCHKTIRLTQKLKSALLIPKRGVRTDPAINCHPGVLHAGQYINACAVYRKDVRPEDPSASTGDVGGRWIPHSVFREEEGSEQWHPEKNYQFLSTSVSC